MLGFSTYCFRVFYICSGLGDSSLKKKKLIVTVVYPPKVRVSTRLIDNLKLKFDINLKQDLALFERNIRITTLLDKKLKQRGITIDKTQSGLDLETKIKVTNQDD
eukprot:TRINITY_DN88175_c0_g1_i1.p3 TRINITY_DN88175_c0_g1~~TRINITY_DN88175_c0_g1_i1.p3  ORF type:complete len:105 (+),score=7.44 TRINITY_DN88175_c0_g1_i1:56-370(+)